MIQIATTQLRLLIKRLFFAYNRTIVKTRNKAQVISLIQRFWPCETGFNLVRVGSVYDGGYLIPNDLQNISGLFSPGVAEDATFEKYFANLSVPCFLADGSISKPPIEHKYFHFTKKFLGLKNDDLNISLDTWVEENTSSNDLILQMDIEGAEFEVLLSTKMETLNRFRIIIVEFHGMDRLITEDGFLLLTTLLSKIESNFIVSHCHPNNFCGYIEWNGITIPRVLEVTFIRQDRVKRGGYLTKFPHNLDSPNVEFLPEMPLPRDWYSPTP